MLLMREGLGPGPDVDRLARERLDVALMALALEQRVTIAFIDHGVEQLRPETGDQRSMLKTIRSLTLYDVEAIYVERQSLTERNIDLVDSIATPIDRQQLSELVAAQELLL